MEESNKPNDTEPGDPSLTMSFGSLADSESDFSSLVRAMGSKRDVDRTGQRLGHFVLQEPLGEGGMGAVYRALDTSLERHVAVKVLRDIDGDGHSNDNAKHIDRLRREAVSQARLNHPRVVTIYYVGRDDEEPFLAMELLAGPTLEQRIKDGPLPYDELVEYAIQVTDALQAADLQGLVHGDIKPSNLLMSEPGSIKLSDFGLARLSDSGDGDGSVSGTPQYIAPEIIDGATPNRQTDMYALGVTLFELAFGRRPFELSGNTLQQRLLTHRTAEIEFPQKWPSNIPEGFRETLSKLLSKDPAHRPKSYQGLRSDLIRIRPIGSTLAGRLARFIAWVVDSLCLLLLGLPFIVPNVLLQAGLFSGPVQFDFGSPDQGETPFGSEVFSPPIYRFLFGSLALVGWTLVPFVALWWDLKRYRTPGRLIMQLRVVDKYGLPPNRRVLVFRNIMRYFYSWSSLVFAIPMVLGFLLAGIIDDVLTQLWVLIDGALIFGTMRRTIHDRICDTHVVLDEQASSRRSMMVPGSSIHTPN